MSRNLLFGAALAPLVAIALSGCGKSGANSDMPVGHRSGEALSALPGGEKQYKLNPALPHAFSKNVEDKTLRRVKIDEVAPNFAFKTLDGKAQKLSNLGGKAALFVFADTTCPCVLAYNQRLKALNDKFGALGLRTVFVFSNGKTDTPDAIAQFVRAQDYPWTIALDLDQKLLKVFDASCSTEAFLFDAKQRLRYHGRIDDDTFQPGAVRERDLQSAVVAVLDGRAVPQSETKAFGCAIPKL